MRIIAGKFRGRKLKSPPSQQTRPTSDRLRETLFNVLAPGIAGTRFLDLCAGTGAVGIEAISRGAEQVTFVDQSRKMCALIDANLESLGIEANEITIICAEAAEFMKRQVKRKSERFDMIFFDPPYAADYESVLDGVAELLNAEGIVIVEHHKKRELAEEFGQLRRYRELKQGDSVLGFYAAAA